MFKALVLCGSQTRHRPTFKPWVSGPRRVFDIVYGFLRQRLFVDENNGSIRFFFSLLRYHSNNVIQTILHSKTVRSSGFFHDTIPIVIISRKYIVVRRYRKRVKTRKQLLGFSDGSLRNLAHFYTEKPLVWANSYYLGRVQKFTTQTNVSPEFGFVRERDYGLLYYDVYFHTERYIFIESSNKIKRTTIMTRSAITFSSSS